MKNLISVALSVVAVCVILTGCAMPSNRLGHGGIYGDAIEPVAATSSANSSKTGKSCSSNILGIIATGDASVDAAKKDGGITTVSTVDVETTNILTFYATVCTIVHGS